MRVGIDERRELILIQLVERTCRNAMLRIQKVAGIDRYGVNGYGRGDALRILMGAAR